MEIKAGERKRIIHRVSSSIPATFQVEVRAHKPDARLAGNVAIEKSIVFIDKKTERLPLTDSFTLNKGFFDGFYTVYVESDEDITVTVNGVSPKQGSSLLIYALTLGFISIAVAIFLLFT